MDPRARVQMKEILRELRKMGKTILISSHILPELAELCTSIGIIEQGKMIISGPVDEIMAKVKGTNIIKMRTLGSVDKGLKILKEDPSVNEIYEDENSVEFEFAGEEAEAVILLKRLLNNDIPVISFSPTESNLEEIFMKVTKGEIE